MSRKDFYNDPDAPAANSLVVAASAIVTNSSGSILVHRRVDNDLWALPGGGMELGESIADTVVREVREETGLNIKPLYVVAIYSDPKHVFAYSNGEVRQEFSVCIACSIKGGTLSVSNESKELRFVDEKEIYTLRMHPRIRVRIEDYLKGVRAELNPNDSAE